MVLRDGNERNQVKAQALVTADKAAAIFAAAATISRGPRRGSRAGFRAVALSRAHRRVPNQVRRFESQNVLARMKAAIRPSRTV